MRFEFFHERFVDVEKVSVDGIVPGVGLHLSHWDGNRTPASLKADTSTEIALRFVAAADRAELARGAELATNNHFDTDGTLSVWTVVEGERALERAALVDLAPVAARLSALEPGGAAWLVDDGELSSALKPDAVSRLAPAAVAAELRVALV